MSSSPTFRGSGFSFSSNPPEDSVGLDYEIRDTAGCKKQRVTWWEVRKLKMFWLKIRHVYFMLEWKSRAETAWKFITKQVYGAKIRTCLAKTKSKVGRSVKTLVWNGMEWNGKNCLECIEHLEVLSPQLSNFHENFEDKFSSMDKLIVYKVIPKPMWI